MAMKAPPEVLNAAREALIAAILEDGEGKSPISRKSFYEDTRRELDPSLIRAYK